MIKKITSYVVIFVIGAAIGTYLDQFHTIEEKIVYKDRVKTVLKERITEAPDGTKITEREVVKKEKKDGSATKIESKPVKKDWGLGVKYDLLGGPGVYTLEIHRRVFSDLYISGYGRTDGVAGVGVTFFF